ncbi:GNAT family N-acetyltransferase [Taibaiella soli]|uniref:GNAT family N-acetyltransferase n=1 Tax=Taibaiella soli TaxID=1649169 RepID=A0A2W2C469_9BACT|nr:GNAT family N-acetyltransferase [Taibaiella soli]PZF74923.1 GNAT family N-acetyltransferase [Taibaiella soli]
MLFTRIEPKAEPPGAVAIGAAAEIRFIIQIAGEEHFRLAEMICEEMYVSAIERGSGIARRTPESIQAKMKSGQAVIAFTASGEWAGFSYISAWDNDRYVSNSGLIVAHAYRKSGVAARIKQRIFELSREKYPYSKIFSLTSGLAVMKMNTRLGFEPVTYSELTRDEHFWEGCKSCINYPTLMSKGKTNCLCTAMLFDPLAAAHKA